jgi:transposase
MATTTSRSADKAAEDAAVIQLEQWMHIKELQHQGLSHRQIAKITGHTRNTVAKILAQEAPPSYPKREAPSKLDPFKAYLKARYEAFGLSGVRLLEEIEAQGFTGSLDIVQRYLKTLKDQKRVAERATVRFETPPGHQAQVDWAEVGYLEGRKVYAFTMVLGFSRMLFVTFTFDQKLPTLIGCHQEAFAFFGGIPASILYDNMAQVRLPGSRELNPLMADFAAHHGFAVKTHRPYRPRTKGKIERSIHFVQDNFLKGRCFADKADMTLQGFSWMNQVNARVHGTTGQRPVDLMARENLTPLSTLRPYVLALRQERRVDAESYVRLHSSRYSVPPEYIGQRVVVIQQEQRITIRQGEMILAEHPQAPKRGSCMVHKEHIAALWRLSQARTPAAATACFEQICPQQVALRPLWVYEEAHEPCIEGEPTGEVNP